MERLNSLFSGVLFTTGYTYLLSGFFSDPNRDPNAESGGEFRRECRFRTLREKWTEEEQTEPKWTDKFYHRSS